MGHKGMCLEAAHSRSGLVLLSVQKCFRMSNVKDGAPYGQPPGNRPPLEVRSVVWLDTRWQPATLRATVIRTKMPTRSIQKKRTSFLDDAACTESRRYPGSGVVRSHWTKKAARERNVAHPGCGVVRLTVQPDQENSERAQRSTA